MTVAGGFAGLSIIAGHATRMTIDVLTRPNASIFASPAYAVGLRAAWIFREPFDTWPITFRGRADWSVADPEASAADTIALITELLPDGNHGADPPS